jgi:CBS domain-containing protein
VSLSKTLDAARAAAIAADHVTKHMTRSVVTVEATTSLGELARILATRRISGAVVMAKGKAVGVVSERDVVRAAAMDGVRWSEQRVGSVMSKPVRFIEPEKTVGDAIEQLVRHRIRRLPVVSEDGEILGVLTQTDLLHALHKDLQQQAVADDRS